MIVGATELMVSIGTGAPARIDSSKNTNCSMGVIPLPPHSLGHPTPAQPSAHICFQVSFDTWPTPSPCRRSSSTAGVSNLS